MPDVVIAEFTSPAAVAALQAEFDVLNDPGLGEDRTELLAAVAEAKALVVRNKTRVDVEVLAAAEQLRVVARLGVGLDNIDVTACRERGIEVAPATGANAVAVAEYVIGSLLALIRGVFDQTARVIEGEWPRDELRGGELAGKRLGLVGFGLIARQVAGRALAMGMEVWAHDPYLEPDDPGWTGVERVELDGLMAGTDAISIHVPLNENTRHLIDSSRIRSIRPGSVLVNTSRGGVVDEAAVVDALHSGHLGGAALDVFETEPIDEETRARFRGVPGLILTPHIAGITGESEARIGEMTVATVRRHLGHKP